MAWPGDSSCMIWKSQLIINHSAKILNGPGRSKRQGAAFDLTCDEWIGWLGEDRRSVDLHQCKYAWGTVWHFARFELEERTATAGCLLHNSGLKNYDWPQWGADCQCCQGQREWIDGSVDWIKWEPKPEQLLGPFWVSPSRTKCLPV